MREDLSNLVIVKAGSAYNATSHSGVAGTMRLFVSIKNNTDETLDDVAAISGTMEILWTPPIDQEGIFERKRTFKLSPNDVFYAKNFNRQTKHLTLDPGDSIIIITVWNLKTNDSTYLLNVIRWIPDNQCWVYFQALDVVTPRRISRRQNFLLKADIKLFDRLAVLHIQQVNISQCIMFPHIKEANEDLGLPTCKDLSQFDPCSVVGQ